ncbi:alpha/beta fold hydrolase [Paraglaciecola arctica]|uniref:Alpha/beta hydrolase fold n=1 Tax=Paraglaciecola arctica BSs20135 TaxID=493475 RepID=K6ZAE5_9ALTE|nr:alpha/beta hydrolase [Paraglaciecola arctica]GAC20405.1 alpha/beta hydrolase fold [Paraglaciecola arctica BSs20135]
MQQSLEFPLANITLRGIGYGDPSKPMILALHGWLDNAASFQPIAEYLSDYYIVALDITGHGLSSHRSNGAHYHLIDFPYDLHELVESQGWQSFILMGHSMGGIIATIYASCFPEHVSKLISIESFGPMTKDTQSSPSQLRDSILSRLKAQRSEAKHPRSIERTVEARTMVGDIKSESARLLITRNIREENEQLFFTTDRRLRTFSSLRMTEPQAEAFIRNIKCPTLVIMGTQGYDSMRTILKNRLDWVEDLIMVECEGFHHLHMDNPQPVAKEIVGFLS